MGTGRISFSRVSVVAAELPRHLRVKQCSLPENTENTEVASATGSFFSVPPWWIAIAEPGFGAGIAFHGPSACCGDFGDG